MERSNYLCVKISSSKCIYPPLLFIFDRQRQTAETAHF